MIFTTNSQNKQRKIWLYAFIRHVTVYNQFSMLLVVTIG